VSEYRLDPSSDATATPRRLAVLRPETAARVLGDRGETVMTAPHLLLREVILVQLCVVAMALLSLFFDSPLEGIADPTNTPNPAKAPWYFLGLQELLHYFPPVVAGVAIPAMVVIAMVVIPYFRTNLEDRGFLETPSRRQMSMLTTLVAAIAAFLAAWRVWAVLVPTLLLYSAMVLPSLPPCPAAWRRRLIRVTLSDWIMTWFVVVAVILTLIGTFFRGPGWKWIWPWQGGIRL
jgi:quinol---cytochrome c reductase cytochrome c subunit, bacillus type